MASNLQFVITNVGLQAVANAQSGGPSVNITTFQVGTAYNYTPTASMSALQGTSLYSGITTGYSVDSLNQITYQLKMNQTVGTFNFGEVGVYLADGTLFALAAFQTLQEKVAASSSNAGNLVTLIARLLLTGIAPVIQFTNNTYQTAILVEVAVPDGIPLPNSLGSTNVYSVQGGDDVGNPILALRETTAALWGFSTHIPYLTTTVGSVGTTTQTNIAGVNATEYDFAANRYLVQYTSGQNVGVVRYVASIANGLITHSQLPYVAQAGDSVVIYRSVASIANQLQTKTIYGIDSGSTNNYVIAPTGTTSATLKDGMELTFIPKETSTAGSVLNYNETGNVGILKPYVGGLHGIGAFDIAAGSASTVMWSAASSAWILKNVSSYALVNGDGYQPFLAQKLTVSGLNDNNGAELYLLGNGSNPNKTLRANSGSFQVINNAYTQALLTLTDAGDLSALRNFSAVNGTFGGTLASYGSATLGTNANNGGAAFPQYGQGMHITWNHAVGDGETDLVAYQGAGSVGGFRFYNVSSTGTTTYLGGLDGAGNLTIAAGANIAQALTATGLQINGYGTFTQPVTLPQAQSSNQAVNLGQLNTALSNLNNNSIVANLQNLSPELATYTATVFSGSGAPGTVYLGNAPRGWVSIQQYYADAPPAYGASIPIFGLLITRNSNQYATPNANSAWFHQELYVTDNNKWIRYNTNGSGWTQWQQITYTSNLQNGTLPINVNGVTTSGLLVNGAATVNGNLSVSSGISTSNGNIFATNASEADIGVMVAGQNSAYLYNNANQWGLYSGSGGAIIFLERNDPFVNGGTAYPSGNSTVHIGGNLAYTIVDSAQLVIQDGQFLSFGYIAENMSAGDNTDPIAFVRLNPAANTSILQLWLGDDGNDTALPEVIAGSAVDYFQIRSATSNAISHRFSSSGQSWAGGFLARWGAPNNNGTTGYSFYQDGDYDTGLFGLSDGVFGLYANNVQTMLVQPGSVSFNVPINTDSVNAAGSIFVTVSGEAQVGAFGGGQAAAYLFNNANQWGLYSSSGGQMCTFTRSTGRFEFNGTAATLGQGGGAGNTPMTFNWSGQGGQPEWLWGGNDGANMYVYNPSNFSVNYANVSGKVNNIQTTGPSRAIGTTYYNTTGYTMWVWVSCANYSNTLLITNVNGYPFNNGYAPNAYTVSTAFIVPSGGSYSVSSSNSSVQSWTEWY